jgi:hypothetical protein
MSRLPHLRCAGGTLTFQEIRSRASDSSGFNNCSKIRRVSSTEPRFGCQPLRRRGFDFCEGDTSLCQARTAFCLTRPLIGAPCRLSASTAVTLFDVILTGAPPPQSRFHST